MTEATKTLAGVVLQRYTVAPRVIDGVIHTLAVDVRSGDKIYMALCLKRPDRGAKVTIRKLAPEAGKTQAVWVVEP